jgi:hypothetical protein
MIIEGTRLIEVYIGNHFVTLFSVNMGDTAPYLVFPDAANGLRVEDTGNVVKVILMSDREAK